MIHQKRPRLRHDSANVASINSSTLVRAEITAMKPSIYRGDTDVPIRVSALRPS